jgi:hypothetical protein
MPESVEEALRSDGTPFQVVGDTNIIAGHLLDSNGLPQYPIVVSLASEAISDPEIARFTNYVAAGGFLFVGSSAFTRNTNGTTRGDFAFANAMGVHMVNTNLSNWTQDGFFSNAISHQLVSHIPSGQLSWRMPYSAEDIPEGLSPSHPNNYYHLAWLVQAGDATVVANGGYFFAGNNNSPYLLVKSFGRGYFIYDAGMQPLIGHSAFDSGMYAYGIFRNAITWAFQSAKLSIPRLSPWPYPYDAAVEFRHDFEAFTNFIDSTEASAQTENSITNAFGQPARGDYYFCTGALRTQYDPTDQANEIASLKRAISLYGATISSHNGGLTNAQNPALGPFDYDYWHWGPDEALDLTNPPPPGYPDGKTYALTSISNSFSDLRGWGLTNSSGLTEWASPNFNSTREGSKQILNQLGIATAGEEKVGPFPHWTLSAQTSGYRYPFLSLPVSDWYVGGQIGQGMEEQTLDSVDAEVDYYYNLGALINQYGHSSSAGGTGITDDGVTTSPEVQMEYVVHSMAKPRVWPANADILYNWWLKRSTVQVTPAGAINGNQVTTSMAIAGASDTNTAVEFFAPSTNYTGLQVLTNGVSAGMARYRIVGQTIRVLVGTAVTNAQVILTIKPVAQNDAYYFKSGTTLTVAAPGVLANDSSGWGTNLTAILVTGPTNGNLTLSSNGGFTYTPTNNQSSDTFTYLANDGQTNSAPATVTLTIISPPVITSQPANVAVVASNNVMFTVGVNGSVPLNFQWYFNRTNAVGLNTNNLLLNNVQATNAGNYIVVVSNGSGSVTSAPAALIVLITTPAISVRTVTSKQTLELSFATQAELEYFVEYKNALTDDNWKQLLNVSGNGKQVTKSVSMTVPSMRYFRLRVEIN